MTAQATTRIVLRQLHPSGRWSLSRPGEAAQNFDAAQTLNSIIARVGLGAGYWLRTTPEPGATVWTWVAL